MEIIRRNMCKCEIETELGDVIIEGDSAWIYEKSGDFILDFPINFCPFCGENIQCQNEYIQKNKK